MDITPKWFLRQHVRFWLGTNVIKMYYHLLYKSRRYHSRTKAAYRGVLHSWYNFVFTACGRFFFFYNMLKWRLCTQVNFLCQRRWHALLTLCTRVPSKINRKFYKTVNIVWDIGSTGKTAVYAARQQKRFFILVFF